MCLKDGPGIVQLFQIEDGKRLFAGDLLSGSQKVCILIKYALKLAAVILVMHQDLVTGTSVTRQEQLIVLPTLGMNRNRLKQMRQAALIFMKWILAIPDAYIVIGGSARRKEASHLGESGHERAVDVCRADIDIADVESGGEEAGVDITGAKAGAEIEMGADADGGELTGAFGPFGDGKGVGWELS